MLVIFLLIGVAELRTKLATAAPSMVGTRPAVAIVGSKSSTMIVGLTPPQVTVSAAA